jgi:hypothetical protein
LGAITFFAKAERMQAFEKQDDYYRRFVMGEFVARTCDVVNKKDEHCPNEPTRFFEFNGKEVGLCEPCYQNHRAGAFNPKTRFKAGNYEGLKIKGREKC